MCRSSSTNTLRDHPRVRGEHVSAFPGDGEMRGSSPRARGARRRRPVLVREDGIIPACAGSTPIAAWSCPSRRDHPRVRGEHADRGVVVPVAPGSSPRARGARHERHLAHALAGIIPACAGSTALASRARPRGADHPRVRGEHPRSSCSSPSRRGSSPRARGARRG